MPDMPTFKIGEFSTPEEAMQKIEEMELELSPWTNDDLDRIMSRVKNECVSNWYDEIVKKSPEGTKLIVIRDPRYSIQQHLIDKFEGHVKRGIPCHITQQEDNVIWCAFDPNNAPWILDWAMSITNATIEYIS